MSLYQVSLTVAKGISMAFIINVHFLLFQLQELQDKYAECMEMLREAQEELKNLRNKTLPLSTPRRFHSLGLFPMVSEGADSREAGET